MRRAALRGVGVACLPTLLVTEDMTNGSLIRLLPPLIYQPGLIHAVFPSRRGMVPAVRTLLDALAEGFAAKRWLVSEVADTQSRPRKKRRSTRPTGA